VKSHDLNARVQHLTNVPEDYWIRWKEEYLLQLRECYSTVDSVGVTRSPVLGEVIIVHDENHPRNFWKLGRVTDIIQGNDGQVRGAVIDVVTNGKLQTLQRPITRLYPLEVTSETKKNPTIQEDYAQNVTVDVSTSRPVRAAALRARQQVSQWVSDDTE